MKKIISLLCILFFNASFAFICETTVLVNPEKNKKVVLLSDIHGLERYMKDTNALALYSNLASQQSEQLTQFTNDLLGIQDASHIAVATELNASSFGSLYEQEVGAMKLSKSNETILAMPKLLLHAALKNGTDLQASMKPFFDCPTASFSLPNNMRWIAADRYRTRQDAHLAFTIYKNLPHVLNGIKKQSLSDEMKELTVEFVEQYIQDLHTYFEKLGIENSYFELIKEEITEALKTKKIHTNNHFAQLHAYLLDAGKKEERDHLNNNMIGLISLKFDAELLEYVHVFNREKLLTVMLVVAGGSHNEFLKKNLITKGYSVTQCSGAAVKEKSLIEAYESNNMLNLVKELQKNAPLINLDGIIN